MNENAPKTNCCEESDEGVLGMVRMFFTKAMLPTLLFVWAWAIIFMVLAIVCVVYFFRTDVLRDQIAYAAAFVCLVQCIGMMKIFAWQMVHKRQIMAAIRKLQGARDKSRPAGA